MTAKRVPDSVPRQEPARALEAKPSRHQPMPADGGGESPLSPVERTVLETRLATLQTEVLLGELRGLERRRAQLVELGIFEDNPSPPDSAARPAGPKRKP